MPHRHIIQVSEAAVADGPKKGNPCYIWRRKEETVPSFREQIRGLATSLQAMHVNNRLRLRHAH
jgi:hypothetical protein